MDLLPNGGFYLSFAQSLVVEALERERFRLVATPASQLACLVLWLTGPALQLAIAGA